MPKKIIFFIPTLSIGGGERVVSELSLNFPDSVTTTIVLFQNQVSYPYKGKLVCLNIPISNPLPLKVYYFFLCFFRFRKIIRQENPDYVISFGPALNVINLFSSKKNILRVDNVMSCSGKGIIYETMIKLFYNKAPRIVCVSKVSAADLVKNFGIKEEKIKVIHNPLNIKEIKNLALNPLEPEYQKIFEKPVIITVGRLTKQKNHKSLIASFKYVKEKVKGAQLVILGKGELEPGLKRLIKDLKLEKDVHILGWQKNPFKFLSRAKAFVLSSLWEGLPYVLLEAMACSLPVISADCKSGPREILAPDTDINQKIEDVEYEKFGILTPSFDGNPNSIQKLSEAMVKILTDKQLSDNLAKKSLERAEDFDIKNIIKKWDFLLL
jgi:glycosyltransferase involved in cell wall biosynthesis